MFNYQPTTFIQVFHVMFPLFTLLIGYLLAVMGTDLFWKRDKK